MEDYPAAHSMDTTWFAIDQDGNVGIFGSGETGAVPNTAVDATFGLFEFLNEIPKETLEYNADGLFQEGTHELLEDSRRHQQTLYDSLFWLKSKEALTLLRKQKIQPFLFPHPTEIYVFFENISFRQLQSIHNQGFCRACCSGYEYNKGLEFWRIGFFEYDVEDYSVSPYIRRGETKKPLKAEDLPLKFWEQASTVFFKQVHFQQTEKLQPIEHLPCSTWGHDEAWVGTDGYLRNSEGVIILESEEEEIFEEDEDE